MEPILTEIRHWAFSILQGAWVMLFAVFCVLMFVALLGAIGNLRILLKMDEDEDEIQRRDRRS